MRMRRKIWMRYYRTIAAFGLAAVFAAGAAAACIISDGFRPETVAGSDLVVVGRISNYRLIADKPMREAKRKDFYRSGRWEDLADSFAAPGKLPADYARFDIEVDEVLAGKTAKRLTVIWYGAASGQARTRPSGPLLIALQRPVSVFPASPPPEPQRLQVVHPFCGQAYLFPAASGEAGSIRQFLKRGPRP